MSNFSPESKYDKQGAYFWSLVKKSGWTREQVQALMMKKSNKTHWNVLNQLEKRQVIAVLKKYVEKNKKENEVAEKQFRQRIMAFWSKHGHTKEELYDLMVEWGFEPSLRACRYNVLCSIWFNVRKIYEGDVSHKEHEGITENTKI